MGHEHHSHLQRNDYGKFIAVLLTFCLLAVTGYALQHTISCFLLSWVIAYLLDPFLVRAEKNGIKRIYALGLLYVILGILTVFFMTFIVPAITINWNAFIRDLPLYIQKIKQLALEWKARLPDRYGSEEINWLIERATSKVDAAAEKTGNWIYSFGTSIFFNLFNIVLSPILVFFMLYYKQTVKETISSWIPAHRRELILGIGGEVNSSIGGYLRGQIIVSIIVAILATIALFIHRHSSPGFLRILRRCRFNTPIHRRTDRHSAGIVLSLVQIPVDRDTQPDRHRLRPDLLR